MNLSVNYNFFNGEEIIYDCLKNMRPMAEHISICYQKVSNLNNPITKKALNILKRIEKESLADDIILYEPDFSITPSQNEFQKRVIGLKYAKKAGCSHFLLSDVDEFYDKNQFLWAKKYIIKNNIHYSACHSYFYVHKPIYRSQKPDTTNICFISKIDKSLILKHDINFPVPSVDPTRRMIYSNGNFKLFSKEELIMHHMNFVRTNFSSKLQNTSSRSDPKLESFLKEVYHMLTNWSFGQIFDFPRKEHFEIIKVKDRFNIKAAYNNKKFIIF